MAKTFLTLICNTGIGTNYFNINSLQTCNGLYQMNEKVKNSSKQFLELEKVTNINY